MVHAKKEDSKEKIVPESSKLNKTEAQSDTNNNSPTNDLPKAEKTKVIKKYLVLGLIAITAIFLILGIIYIAAELNVLLKGDVTLSLDPAGINLLTDKRDPLNISFLLSIDNRLFCDASCSYEFFDISSNKSIASEDFIGTKETLLYLNYTLEPPTKGTGQLAYELYSECINKRTFLCHSEGEKRSISAFVTLGYELSIAERDYVDNLEKSLIGFLENLISFGNKVFNLEKNYNLMLPYLARLKSMQTQISQITQKEDFLLNQSFVLKQLWAEEEFRQLEVELSQLANNLEALNMLVEDTSLEIGKEKQDYGNTRQALLGFDYSIMLLSNASQLRSVIGYPDKSSEREYLQQYSGIISKLLIGNFNNPDDIISELHILEGKIEVFADIAAKEFSLVINEGLSLLNRTTGYELNLSKEHSGLVLLNDICADIRDITKFNLQISSPNNISSTPDTSSISSLNLSISYLADLMDFESSYCNTAAYQSLNLSGYDYLIPKLPAEILFDYFPAIDTEIKKHAPICCIFGRCAECCTTESCTDEEESYPLVLIHGHAFSEYASVEYSLESFNKIRRNLVKEGFIDGGIVLPIDQLNPEENGVLGKYGKPVIFGMTYYLDAYDSHGSRISIPSKSESISTYAKRLNKTIEIVKHKTGADKVNILAFSMGGLVARQYIIDSGESGVNKLIMLGTPNKGVSGKTESLCPYTGAETECIEMRSNGDFINNLNKPENQPKKTKTYVIYGTGCNTGEEDGDGDGAVLASNAQLPYSLNFEIRGSCPSSLDILHNKLKDIDQYPKVFEIIRNILVN